MTSVESLPVITRRHLHLAIALLLPLMVLRALLPAGYMPVAGDGAPRLVMCSGGFAALSGDSDGTDESLPQIAQNCLFAHASSAAPPPARVVVSVLPLSQFTAKTQAAAPFHITSIQRAQGPRGPPAFHL